MFATIGTFIGNLLTDEPLMLIFLMGDYINAYIWAGIKTAIKIYKKFFKKT